MLGLQKLPPSKRRKYITIYVGVTLLGLVVVVFFVYLLVMLSWMDHKAPLPDVARVVQPEAAAYSVMTMPENQQADGHKTVRALADKFLNDLPTPVQKLAHKGMDDVECPVRIVASLLPGKEQETLTWALSLGRYPGRFYFVRRDLKRRMDRGTFAADIETYKGASIFVMRGVKSLPAMVLLNCTILRGRDVQSLEPIIDALLADAPPSLTVREVIKPIEEKAEKPGVSSDGGD